MNYSLQAKGISKKVAKGVRKKWQKGKQKVAQRGKQKALYGITDLVVVWSVCSTCICVTKPKFLVATETNANANALRFRCGWSK